jgi:predicted O-methyltransferase YrrM
MAKMNENKMLPPISYVFAELSRRYESDGLEVLGGFSPFITGFASRTGNYVARGDVFLSTSAGIANDEAVFMYGLCEQIRPKKILIIGNSYGFSTVFLALACPDASLIAFDKYRTEGIKTTNRLLSGLADKEVIQASTPDDIPFIIENRFDGEVDFVLIDAVHTNDIQTAEFEILDDYLSPRSVVVFHDVLSCGLLTSLSYLKKKFSDYDFRIINKSSTGIAVCVKGEKNEHLENFLRYFSVPNQRVLDFNCLMLKNLNESAAELFSNCDLKYRFLPHPQL